MAAAGKRVAAGKQQAGSATPPSDGARFLVIGRDFRSQFLMRRSRCAVEPFIAYGDLKMTSSTFAASSGDGYELQMGRWSRRLAGPFLDFCGIKDGETVKVSADKIGLTFNGKMAAAA